MNDNFVLVARIFAVFLFDWSLAVACGGLLAAYWLRNHHSVIPGESSPFAVRFPRLRVTALLMTISLCVQFYVLTVTFTGKSRISDLINYAPSVATTHGGKFTLYLLSVSVLLLITDTLTSFKRTAALSHGMAIFLMILILALHSAVGHAAMDGNFSLLEVLQFLHLSATALWAGGVIVSGFFIAPRLFISPSRVDETYLRALSKVSTYSVLVVLISGVYKSWLGLDRQINGLFHTVWGRILLTKLCLVAVALALGFVHRQWTQQRHRLWTPFQTGRLLTTLRIEASCLTVVILISAWLSSVDPAGM